MDHLVNHGISQEDAATEAEALALEDGDRVLAVASGGEIPLNLLAKKDVAITAVDPSEPQIHLARFKLDSATYLTTTEAAELIGYTAADPERRKSLFATLAPHLDHEQQRFWSSHSRALAMGPVHAGRFESYMRKMNRFARLILGRTTLLGLVELDSVSEQEKYFDARMATRIVRGIFKVAFHPLIYRKRGIDPAGLVHQRGGKAEFFFGRFRDFCTATPARRNPHLQFALFNQVLFPEALPAFLFGDRPGRLRRRSRIRFRLATYNEELRAAAPRSYDCFHLSNIGDWVSGEELDESYLQMVSRGAAGARGVIRFIHRRPEIPEELRERIRENRELGTRLVKLDRYPFYNVVPFGIREP